MSRMIAVVPIVLVFAAGPMLPMANAHGGPQLNCQYDTIGPWDDASYGEWIDAGELVIVCLTIDPYADVDFYVVDPDGYEYGYEEWSSEHLVIEFYAEESGYYEAWIESYDDFSNEYRFCNN